LSGQIDALFGEVSVMTPHVRADKVVALAVTSPERSRLLPELATTIEAGFPALELESWGGLLVPAGTPADVLARLETAVQRALAEPAFRAGAERQGWSDVTASREAFAHLLARETARWKPIVTSPGFRLD
jgi:tripartite-type tricarboxylate transporter receptor subunit TctC